MTAIFTHTYTHTHTQPFYGSLNFVQDYPGNLVPKGKSNLDFSEARYNEWQLGFKNRKMIFLGAA